MTGANTDQQQLDDVFAALANTTRRSMLAHLATGPATVSELAEPFDMSLPAVSKHLKVLEHAGLVARTRNAQYRPCHIQLGPLLAAASWLVTQENTWNESFDRLDAQLLTDPTTDSPSPNRKKT